MALMTIVSRNEISGTNGCRKNLGNERGNKYVKQIFHLFELRTKHFFVPKVFLNVKHQVVTKYSGKLIPKLENIECVGTLGI